MRLNLRFRDLDAPAEARASVEREVRREFALHTNRLLSAQVTLRRSPPMHGLGRSSCHIRVRLRDGQSFSSEDHAASVEEAAAAVAWRIGQRIERSRSLRAPLARDSSFRRNIA